MLWHCQGASEAHKETPKKENNPMPEFDLLAWFNSNGVAVGALCSLIGFWLGFRTNLWIARRNEWNAVVDRVRAGLLKSRRYDNHDLRIDDEDIDSLIHQAGWNRRRKIHSALERHAAITQDYHQNSLGGVSYYPPQIEEMKQLRERMLGLVVRR